MNVCSRFQEHSRALTMILESFEEYLCFRLVPQMKILILTLKLEDGHR